MKKTLTRDLDLAFGSKTKPIISSYSQEFISNKIVEKYKIMLKSHSLKTII